MQRRDFERAYKLQKQILELQRISEIGIEISRRDLRKLQAEYDEIKQQFEAFADTLPCEIYLLLELRFFYAWSYNMIRKNLNWYGLEPRATLEEYFSTDKRNKRRKRKH